MPSFRKPEQLAVYNLLRRIRYAKIVCADFRKKTRYLQLDAMYTIRDLLQAADEVSKMCMAPGIHTNTQKAAAKHVADAFDLAHEVARDMRDSGEFFWVARDIHRMLAENKNK